MTSSGGTCPTKRGIPSRQCRLSISGIDSKVKAREAVTLTLLIPAKLKDESVSCKVKVEAHVIHKLPVGQLLGTDTMMVECIVINLDNRKLVFNGHQEATVLFHTVRKTHPSPSHKVCAQIEMEVAPGAEVGIPY